MQVFSHATHARSTLPHLCLHVATTMAEGKYRDAKCSTWKSSSELSIGTIIHLFSMRLQRKNILYSALLVFRFFAFFRCCFCFLVLNGLNYACGTCSVSVACITWECCSKLVERCLINAPTAHAPLIVAFASLLLFLCYILCCDLCYVFSCCV